MDYKKIIDSINKIKKPSQALQYAYDGLNEAYHADNVKIKMSTYGNKSNDICYGCVATFSIIKSLINKVDYKNSSEYIHERINMAIDPGVSAHDRQVVYHFELMINAYRLGDIEPLLNYFLIDRSERKIFYENLKRPVLNDDNWKIKISDLKSDIKFFKSQGL